MPECGFFGNIEILHQMMGNLFYRGVSTSEIQKMTISEMKYWNGWHNVLRKEAADQNKKYEKALKGIK
jgi:hypothetical protein